MDATSNGELIHFQLNQLEIIYQIGIIKKKKKSELLS